MNRKSYDLEEMFTVAASTNNSHPSSVTKALEGLYPYVKLQALVGSPFDTLMTPLLTESIIKQVNQSRKELHKSLGGKNDEVQPRVKELLKLIIILLSKNHENYKKYKYSLNGRFFPSSHSFPTESDPHWRRQTRVYFPYSGIPDLELNIRLVIGFNKNNNTIRNGARTRSQTKADASDPAPPDKLLVFQGELDIDFKNACGPPGEIKVDFKDYPENEIIQAGMYGFHFLLRVFPMLPESDLLKIFKDRCVYVPLLTLEKLIIVKVDVKDFIVFDGKPKFLYSQTFSGEEYCKNLIFWVDWAFNVSDQLYGHQVELDGFLPINGWIPATVYSTECNIDASTLQARPSFYNPIYKDNSRYYRIWNTWWTSNFKSKIMLLEKRCPALFNGWAFYDTCMSLPNFGTSLDKRVQEIDTSMKLCKILIQVLEQLALVGKTGYCHMDVRAANIIVNPEFSRVHLIDYDFCTSHFKENPMNPKYCQSPRDQQVCPNTDMWSFGVMVKKIVCVGLNEGNYIEDLPFKPRFQCHKDSFSVLIKNCLKENPDERISIADALKDLRSLMN